MNPDGILYLCRSDVENLSREIDSVAIISNVFKMHGSGQTVLPDEAYLGWKNERNEQVRNLNMPAYLGGTLRIAGTKIINSNIQNPRRGLPRASGITLLYDNTNVHVTCIMEGAYISSLRTASVTACATELLTGNPIRCIAVIGAGALAKAHIDLFVRRLPGLRQILVYDLEKQRIEVLNDELSSLLLQHGVTLTSASTAKEAIRQAELIIPVTTTTEGYIHYNWLQPGALLVNVSLDDVLPEVVFKADSVIVDDWNLVKNDPRRLIGRMFRSGQIIGPDENENTVPGVRRRIDAQLGDIATGIKVGRQDIDDIILVNPFGLAIEDVAIASHIYQLALQREIGQWLSR